MLVTASRRRCRYVCHILSLPGCSKRPPRRVSPAVGCGYSGRRFSCKSAAPISVGGFQSVGCTHINRLRHVSRLCPYRPSASIATRRAAIRRPGRPERSVPVSRFVGRSLRRVIGAERRCALAAMRSFVGRARLYITVRQHCLRCTVIYGNAPAMCNNGAAERQPYVGPVAGIPIFIVGH